MKSTTDFPDWISPAALANMDKKRVFNLKNVEITDTGIQLDTETLQSQRWLEFTQSEHTGTIEGDKLIIRKK